MILAIGHSTIWSDIPSQSCQDPVCDDLSDFWPFNLALFELKIHFEISFKLNLSRSTKYCSFLWFKLFLINFKVGFPFQKWSRYHRYFPQTMNQSKLPAKLDWLGVWFWLWIFCYFWIILWYILKMYFFYIRNFLFILSVDLGMLPKGGKIAPLHGQRTNNPFITINCPQTIFSEKSIDGLNSFINSG